MRETDLIGAVTYICCQLHCRNEDLFGGEKKVSGWQMLGVIRLTKRGTTIFFYYKERWRT